ncbi:MAG: peptidase family protein [Ilumatobacteraceae bacterium]|nr:peptidase family protein [Ilumatobacteraceae bacterium]
MTDTHHDRDGLTGQTVELLQTLIRNQCVNDGTPGSGHETRSVDVLQSYLEGSGIATQRYEPTPGRASLVARIEGTDPDAPSVCLMGHTDVVPANPDSWTRDPFGGELVDGEVWGRGAVDMLNLTASMAVAVHEMVRRGFRPRGDLIYFAVADEESGSAHGAQWMADHATDDIRCDYLLTESGGVHSGSSDAPFVGVNVGEKGVAWRKLRVRGTPGHGSAPYRSDNALVKAAAVIQRLTAYAPEPRVHEMWRQQVASFQLGEDATSALLDPARIDDAIAAMPLGLGRHLHACSHTTFSCNLVEGPMKHNTIPGAIDIGVDIRTLPGEDGADVERHLREALGELADDVEVEIVMNDPASMSRTDNPMWDALQRGVTRQFPTARLVPQMMVGFTDARIFRRLGSVAYGTGLFSPDLDAGDYGSRFHGNDERIDVESLRLTTQFWLDVVGDMLG